MDSKNLKKMIYITSHGKKVAFPTKRMAINFVPFGRCTNKCIFCLPNISAIKKLMGNEVLLRKSYTIDEMAKTVLKTYKQNPNCSEIVITGTIGEPLLYFNKLLKFISLIKTKISLPVRLNTNGQATSILPKYSSRQICQLLEKTGLDSIAISLNSINKKDYNKLCRPTHEDAFNSVVDFIKNLRKSKIKTYVSFVDYSKTHPNFPKLNKNKIKEFCHALGVNEKQIIYRPIIE